MADERLIDFPAKTTPTPSDIVFASDASNLYSEVKITIENLISAYPNLLAYGSLSLPNNSYVFKNGAGVLTTGTITAFGASILEDANPTDLLSTLGLGDAAFVNLPITADQGGTGVINPTNHGIAIAQGSNPYSYVTLGDGQLLIGRAGLDPVAATLTAGTNVTINNTAGAITIDASGVSSITAGTGLTGGVITGSGTIALDIPVPITSGGTGQITSSAAFNALSPLTTKGDLLAYNAGNVRLGVGTDNYILAADSSEPTGLKWVPQAGIGTFVQLSGDTMTGALLAPAVPMTDPNQLVTKAYVDALALGLKPKVAYFASTANLAGYTYYNGVANDGVGATLTAPGNGVFSADGVTPAVGTRFLYKDATTPAYNGIYTLTVSSVGAAAVLMRATDYDTPAEIQDGDLIIIQNGTQAGAAFIQTNAVTSIGVDPIQFNEFGSTGVTSITAGTGLTGGTITSAGTINLDIPVTVDHGGTGVISATQHGIAIGRGTLPLNFQTLNDGQFLVGSTGNAPVPTTLVAGTNITLTPAAGTITIDATGGGGGITYNVVAGTTQAMAVNQGYITTNGSKTTLTLPASAAQGDRVEIVGNGTGGWRLAQNSGQTIHFNSFDTTAGTGGYIESSNRYNSISLVCVLANTDWVVVASSGALTAV